jgi:hypothetical protein
MNIKSISFIFGVLFLVITTLKADPVGSQFTYQGSLTDNGSPANGSYDLWFELLENESDNFPLADMVIEDIDVDRGLFSVELDFGDAVFTGDDYFIRVLVRPGNSTDTYTALSPVQRINAAPYAIQSAFLNDNGAVAGQVLKFNGSEWAPANESASQWSDRTNGIAYNNGNVLIGGSNNNQVSTDTSLFIETSAGDSPLRARVNGSTKFQVRSNGGTNIGGGPTAADNGLYVSGETTLNNDLTVNGITNLDRTSILSPNGVDPMVVSVNGQFALQVSDNLGVNVGAANANVIPPPSSGLYVQGETELNQKTTITDDLEISGDAKHSNPTNGYGFAKAGITFSCGNAGTVAFDSFNNINNSAINVSNGVNSGSCVVNLPFSYQGLFFMTSAEYNSGPTIVNANCNKSIQGGVNEVVICRVRDLNNNAVVASRVTLLMF